MVIRDHSDCNCCTHHLVLSAEMEASDSGGIAGAQGPTASSPVSVDYMCMLEATTGEGQLCPEEDLAEVVVISASMAFSAFEEVPIPTAILNVQPPGGITLVNLATNFYTEATPFNTTVTLVGQDVELAARPSGFTWDFGDGTSQTTTRPGAPHPDLQVTHAYLTAGDFTVGLTVTWTADYRVNGGPWFPVNGTVDITSADVPLTAQEATPVLTG